MLAGTLADKRQRVCLHRTFPTVPCKCFLMIEPLRPFQLRFQRAVEHGEQDTLVLSLPRGNGKSALAAHLLSRCLTHGDSLHVCGSEYLLCAASIEQARLVFRFCRAELEPTGLFSFLDSVTRIGITLKGCNTRLRVLSSNSKTAMGIVGTALLVADEPGSWEVTGGGLMFDAIQTAMGKPGSPLRAVYIGTIAPSRGGWWQDLVEGGTTADTYVQALQGEPSTWDTWPTIRRVNPLTAVSAPFRKKLLSERDAARRDSRLKARFLSYRLNIPTADEATQLLSVDDWERVVARPVPERSGRPILAVDLGGGRAWSAAVAVWQNGRVECLASAPGIPSVEVQERRDNVPAGTYTKLLDAGVLTLADGLRVQPPAHLLDLARQAWGHPEVIVCDRFRLAELRDCVNGAKVEARVSRWSESTFDINALRRAAKDGPLTVAEASRPLMTASLAVATTKADDAGNVRLSKRGTNNQARDDVAAALVLGMGLLARVPVARSGVYLGST